MISIERGHGSLEALAAAVAYLEGVDGGGKVGIVTRCIQSLDGARELQVCRAHVVVQAVCLGGSRPKLFWASHCVGDGGIAPQEHHRGLPSLRLPMLPRNDEEDAQAEGHDDDDEEPLRRHHPPVCSHASARNRRRGICNRSQNEKHALLPLQL